MTTRPAAELTLADRLSHLTYAQACRILGPRAKELLRAGGICEIQLDEQIRLDAERFVLELPDARVSIELADGERVGLACRCSACAAPCAHAGSALAMILEEKLALGLAAPPPERVPAERQGDEALVQRAIEERRERSRAERMTVRSGDSSRPWADYVVTSALSGRSYRVALRGLGRDESYCSCPDFRKNTLGTCKHLLRVQAVMCRRFPAARLRQAHRRRTFSLYLRHGNGRALHLGVPARTLPRAVEAAAAPLRDRAIDDLPDLMRRLRRLDEVGEPVTIYPDAEELIQERLIREHSRALVAEIRHNPAAHPLRRELLATELLPYQLDGIAFAVEAGRAVLADDMGLGKTIQGIGVAEVCGLEANTSILRGVP